MKFDISEIMRKILFHRFDVISKEALVKGDDLTQGSNYGVQVFIHL